MRAKKEKISELTVNRLSVYLRCLNELKSEGARTVSSQALAGRFNLNSAQIRKDLAYFGEFGVRGLGYGIDDLRERLIAILGLDTAHRIGVVGAGNLGTALANYDGFGPQGFSVAALFDADPAKIGRILRDNIEVFAITDFARVRAAKQIDIAAIAVPASAAEPVLEIIVTAGVKAVLNFAPIRLQAREDVKIRNVDLLVSLEALSYSLARRAAPSDDQSTGTLAAFADASPSADRNQ